ncbi:MAG TPA: hypothetical protein P5079_09715, partial [Elusimicrobiota bacterium]|nr:hypothetical protein [Elusimicrobiota bacterium]
MKIPYRTLIVLAVVGGGVGFLYYRSTVEEKPAAKQSFGEGGGRGSGGAGGQQGAAGDGQQAGGQDG